MTARKKYITGSAIILASIWIPSLILPGCDGYIGVPLLLTALMGLVWGVCMIFSGVGDSY